MERLACRVLHRNKLEVYLALVVMAVHRIRSSFCKPSSARQLRSSSFQVSSNSSEPLPSPTTHHPTCNQALQVQDLAPRLVRAR